MDNENITISGSLVPEVNDAILSRINSDGKVALISLDDDDAFFNIEGLAIKVWEGIDGKESVDGLIEKVLSDSSIPRERFFDDSYNFLKELYQEKIISFKNL